MDFGHNVKTLFLTQWRTAGRRKRRALLALFLFHAGLYSITTKQSRVIRQRTRDNNSVYKHIYCRQEFMDHRLKVAALQAAHCRLERQDSAFNDLMCCYWDIVNDERVFCDALMFHVTKLLIGAYCIVICLVYLLISLKGTTIIYVIHCTRIMSLWRWRQSSWQWQRSAAVTALPYDCLCWRLCEAPLCIVCVTTAAVLYFRGLKGLTIEIYVDQYH